jgi:hypothetical protein
VELLIDSAELDADASLGTLERCGDLFVAHAEADKIGDLAFGWGQTASALFESFAWDRWIRFALAHGSAQANDEKGTIQGSTAFSTKCDAGSVSGLFA